MSAGREPSSFWIVIWGLVVAFLALLAYTAHERWGWFG